MSSFFPPPGRALLRILLLADALFIAGHIAVTLAMQDDPGRLVQIMYGRFNISEEHGLPEAFNYGKWVIAWVFALVALSRPGLPGVVVASAALFIDDAAQVHEKMGGIFADLGLPERFGIDANAQGELVGFALLGAVVGLGLLFAFLRGDAGLRRVLLGLGGAIAGMFLCGMVADLLHGLSHGWGSVLLSEFLGIVEDGGEMVFISVYAALVFGMFAERPY
jgi:hypothetical protein